MNFKVFNKGDWKVLVICLLIAVTFWFINSLNKKYTFEISYPLRINYDQKKYIPTEGLPTKIRLSAKANGWDLLANAVGWNNQEIVVDLQSFKNNRFITSKKLLPIIDDFVSNMEIVDMIEDTLSVKFEKLSSKKIKLILEEKDLKLREGYHLAGKVKLTPKEIEVFGPEKSLKKVSSNYNVLIEDENISGDYDENVEIHLPDLLYTEEKQVVVSFQTYKLSEVTIEKSIDLTSLSKEIQEKLKNKTVEVLVFCRKEDIPFIEKDTKMKVVGLLEKKPGSNKINLKLINKLDYVHQYKIEPEIIEIDE